MSSQKRLVATDARITRVFIDGQEIPQLNLCGDKLLNGDPIPTIVLDPPRLEDAGCEKASKS